MHAAYMIYVYVYGGYGEKGHMLHYRRIATWSVGVTYHPGRGMPGRGTYVGEPTLLGAMTCSIFYVYEKEMFSKER